MPVSDHATKALLLLYKITEKYLSVFLRVLHKISASLPREAVGNILCLGSEAILMQMQPNGNQIDLS